jgi:hypothetical protein
MQGAEARRRRALDPARPGGPPTLVDAVDVGEQDQRVGAELGGEERRAQVLVDDGLDADVSPRPRDDRDAPAAGADHGDAGVDQEPDRRQLDDAAGLRRGDDPSPPRAVRRDRPAAPALHVRRGRRVVHRADRLGGRPERGIRGIHHDLGEDRREPVRREVGTELLLEDVADHPLGLRVEHVERVRRGLGARLVLEGEQPHLRAVPVRDDELVVAGDLGERFGGDLGVRALHGSVERFAPLQQRVAPEGGDDEHQRVPPANAFARASRPPTPYA